MSFNDMIVNRPWDIKNMERLGSSNSGLLIYQDTWINMIKGTEVEVLYNQSEKQKQLAELIETKLKQFVYKSKKG